MKNEVPKKRKKKQASTLSRFGLTGVQLESEGRDLFCRLPHGAT